jgi:hypothetical protein
MPTRNNSTEPQLNEIVNMTVDAERGTGTPAVVYDNREFMRQMNERSEFKARNDMDKYKLFLGKLENMYKDVNEVAKMDVMTEDREYLQQKMGEVVKEIGENPRAFFQGGQKHAEIMGKIATLQSEATESKQNKLFDTAHRAYFYRNPDLESDDNKTLIENFRTQKLGTRKPYQLNLPGLYDPAAIANIINKTIEQKEEKPFVTPDNQFVGTEKTTRYDPKKYRDMAAAYYDMPDKNGNMLRNTLKKRFDSLPQEMKAEYIQKGGDDPVKTWYLEIQERYRSQDETLRDQKPNSNYVNPDELAIKRGELAVKWANHNLAKKELEKEDADDLINADTVLNEATSIIKQGVPTVVYDEVNKKNVTVLRVSDPEVLKKFSGIDKDGKTTNVADFLQYNTDKDQIELGYYKSESTGGLGGLMKKKGTGRRIDKIVPMDSRGWLKSITDRSFPTGDKGKVNAVVERILQANGGSLYKIASGEKTPKYSMEAEMQDGKRIFSNDGKKWVDAAGMPVN